MTEHSRAWRFAVDRGGTFTDVVATTPDGRLVTDKLLSENPGHYDDAATEAVRRLMADHGEAPIAELRIGTTVATNALLEQYAITTAHYAHFGRAVFYNCKADIGKARRRVLLFLTAVKISTE